MAAGHRDAIDVAALRHPRLSMMANSDAGKRRMEITDASSPSKVTIKPDFIEPFEGHNVAVLSLVPQDASTVVTWTMDEPESLHGEADGRVHEHGHNDRQGLRDRTRT